MNSEKMVKKQFPSTEVPTLDLAFYLTLTRGKGESHLCKHRLLSHD